MIEKWRDSLWGCCCWLQVVVVDSTCWIPMFSQQVVEWWVIQGWNDTQCNAAFILLVFFITLIILSVSYAVNVFYGSAHVPMILHSFNDHQLAMFLLVGMKSKCHSKANVLTGAVNMCIKTMLVDSTISLVILFVYMMILCLSACLIDQIKK